MNIEDFLLVHVVVEKPMHQPLHLGKQDRKKCCFWCEVVAGHLELKEAEAAKWLTKDQLDSVAWLPADVTVIDVIRACMK